MTDEGRRKTIIGAGKKICMLWYVVPAAVLLLGIISLIMIIWMNELRERQRANFALSDALMDFQIKTAMVHLWLEESLTEGTPLMGLVRSRLTDAEKLMNVVLHGGESEYGIILDPPRNPDLRAGAEKAAALLTEFAALAEKRHAHPVEMGIGSAMDERFDGVFDDLHRTVKVLEGVAERKLVSDYKKTTRLFIGICSAWSLLVIAATAGLWRLESMRKRAEMRQAQLVEELAGVNRELNDFASIVSHDLKAPLRAIGSLARWLVNDYADKFDEQGREKVNLLVSRVKRLDQLIGCVLQYSRAGCDREEKSAVDFNGLVSSVIDMLSPPANIRIIVEGKLPVIVCSKVRFEQVFQNLLSNAVKFMDKPNGEIRVGCTAEDGYWKFHVKDNGPGIEKEHFEKIFRLFETLKPRDGSENTGFGLALVKKIVELYGGRVWVESEVGKGSTFYFTVKGDVNREAR
jgi:signal transduction histidine kinase